MLFLPFIAFSKCLCAIRTRSYICLLSMLDLKTDMVKAKEAMARTYQGHRNMAKSRPAFRAKGDGTTELYNSRNNHSDEEVLVGQNLITKLNAGSVWEEVPGRDEPLKWYIQALSWLPIQSAWKLWLLTHFFRLFMAALQTKEYVYHANQIMYQNKINLL